MPNDIRQFITKFLIYGIGSAAQSFVGFLLIPIFTKSFSAAQYGIYTMVWLVGTVFSSIMYLGVASALPKFFYIDNNHAKQKSAFSTGYYLVFSAMLFQVFIGFAFSSTLSYLCFDAETYRAHICLSILGSAVVFLNYYLATFLRILDKAIEFIIFNLALMISTLLVTYYLFEVQSDKLISPFLAVLVVNALFCVLLTGFFFFNKWLDFCFDKKLAAGMLAFGFPMAVSSMASMVVDWSDRFILEYFSGLGPVGIYSLSYKVAGLVNVLLVTPFVQIWGPIMMKKKDDPDVKAFFLHVFQGYWFVSCSILLFLMFFYHDLEPYIVKSTSYGDISILVLMLTLGLLMYGLCNILNCGLLYANKTQWFMWINYSCALLNVALSFVMIPYWGAYGAAIATLISYMVIPLVMHHFSNKFFEFSPFRKSFWGLISSVAILSACLLLTRYAPDINIYLKAVLFFAGLVVLAAFLLQGTIKFLNFNILSKRVKV